MRGRPVLFSGAASTLFGPRERNVIPLARCCRYARLMEFRRGPVESLDSRLDTIGHRLPPRTSLLQFDRGAYFEAP